MEKFWKHFAAVQLVNECLTKGRYSGESVTSWYGGKRNPKLFDVCNGLGEYLSEAPPEILDSYERLFRVITAIKTLSAKNNFSLAVLIFPQRFQVQPEDWQCTVRDYQLNEHCFDLAKPNTLIT